MYICIYTSIYKQLDTLVHIRTSSPEMFKNDKQMSSDICKHVEKSMPPEMQQKQTFSKYKKRVPGNTQNRQTDKRKKEITEKTRKENRKKDRKNK